MGGWNYYFVAKLGLFLGGYIGLHRWENLLFAVVLLIPLRHQPTRMLRLSLAVPIGIVLLYHDSYLPPISRLFSQWSALSSFSTDYLWELAGRLVNVRLIGTLLALFLVVASLSLKFRTSSFVLLGLALAPLAEPTPGWLTTALTSPQATECDTAADRSSSTEANTGAVDTPKSDTELTAALQGFYAREAGRQVSFPGNAPGSTPFDIVLVHVCSLAWDDMRFIKDEHPLFQRFDVLFDHFNSAATYSGPASIRVLRSSCGQTSESALYDPAAPPCYLFSSLAATGYTPKVLLNHDGNYENFLKNLMRLGGLDAPALGNLGARVRMKAFYGSPIYEDYDILARWQKQRSAAKGGPVALYYNTISLHDGNKIPGKETQTSLDTYQSRLNELFDDLERFFADLEHAARPTVVMFVPEHGAALRGEKTQIAGMREIPSPAITRVPVGIKLIGLPRDRGPQSQIVIRTPISYLALTTFLSELMTNNPWGGVPFDWKTRLDQLPRTDFVAENDKTVMMGVGSSYFMRTPDLSWTKYQAAP